MTNLVGLTPQNPNLTIRLKIKPINKQSTRFTKSGHAYLPAVKAKEKTLVKWLVKQQLPIGFELFDCPLLINYIFVYKKKGCTKLTYKPTKPDFDNTLKAINDALEGVVFDRDQLIVSGTVDKYFYNNDYIYMEIFKLSDNNIDVSKVLSKIEA